MPAKKTKRTVRETAEQNWYREKFRYDIKGIILLGAIFFLLIFSVFNFIALMGVQYEFKNDLQTIKQGITVRQSTLALAQEDYNQESSSFIRRESFGDNFSSFAYIDQANTDMELDEETAAFTFPIRYSLEQVAPLCQNEACGLRRADDCGAFVCPALEDGMIAVRKKTIELPPEVAGQEISTFSSYPLADGWLLGFVVREGEEERGLVYRLEAGNYRLSSIITDQTESAILTKYGKSGGQISFGGTKDDFLIVYGGYQLIAFQVKGGKIEDISRFLGLRVAGGGFLPQITYQGQGNERRWYVCGQASGQAKFVKLWTNGSGSIKGSRSLGARLFSEGPIEDVACQSDSGDSRGVDIALKRDSSWQLWSFGDQGFDNEQEKYQVQSINLSDRPGQVTAAVISDIGACGRTACGLEGFGEAGEAYFSGNGQDFQPVVPKENLLFDEAQPGLFFRAVFLGLDGSDYSPWFDHLNYLNYAWMPE